jgi:CHAT domain-containing protein/Flp pilus assembly protein TadD
MSLEIRSVIIPRGAGHRELFPGLCMLMALLALGGEARSQAPDTPRLLSPQDQKQLSERDDLESDSKQALDKGEFPRAISDFEKMLVLEQKVLGTADRETFGSMIRLAKLNALSGNVAAARQYATDALNGQTQIPGNASWMVPAAKRTLLDIEKWAGMTPQQLERLRKAEQCIAQTTQLIKNGKPTEAAAEAGKAVEIRTAELGPDHPDTLTALSYLGWALRIGGEYDKAEPILRQVLDSRRKILGEGDPDYALSNNVLGWLKVEKQDYAGAETLFRQAADAYRRSQGPWGLDYAAGLDNLAEVFVRTREYRRAEALRLEVVDIRKRVQGENHNAYAQALRSLCIPYEYLREFDKCEPLLLQALEIIKHNVGEKHADYVNCLGDLSYVYRESGKLDKALAIDLQELDYQKQALGPDDQKVALSLHHISSIYIELKDFSKALTYERQAMQIFRKSLGEKNEKFLTSLSNVGWLCEQVGSEAQKREDFAAARKAYAERISCLAGFESENQVAITNGRLSLSYFDQLEKMTADERRQLAEAEELFVKASEIEERSPAEAVAPAEQAWAIRRKLLGDEHWITVNSTFQVGFLYKALGNLAKAEPLYVALPELTRKTRGEHNPNYVTALQNLANLYENTGRYAEAETTYKKALEVVRKTDGDENRHLPTILGNLAVVYTALHRDQEAEALIRQAVAVSKKLFGPRDPIYADSLLRLGGFCMWTLNDNFKAEPSLLEAVEIHKAAVGDKDSRYARAIDFLASCYSRTNRYDLAEPLYEEALAIRKQAYGENHTEVGITLNNLAILYINKKDYSRAEPLLAQALEIDRRVYGPKHLSTALGLAHLADAYKHLGKYTEAAPLLREALAIRKQSVGEHDPDYIMELSKLAAVYMLSNDPARGAPLAREAVHLAREQLDRNETFQSERQQLTSRIKLWFVLDNYIALAGAAGLPADDVYGEVLNWKGLVSAGQQQLHRLHRQLKASGNKEVIRLTSELEATTAQLATLYRARNQQNREIRFRLDELSERVEQIQKQLASASAEFRQQLAQQHRTVDEIRHSLPPDAALVDLVNYERVVKSDPSSTGFPTALVAFVIRSEGAVERVELGPIEPIEKAITRWRQSYGRASAGQDPAEDLRRLVWEPLEKQLAGVKTLLISPNGLTAPIPWPALRVQEPDTYLIDKYAVAIVPIARLLPDLMGRKPVQPAATEKTSVLLVGDVDFGAMPGKSDLAASSRSAVRGQQSMQWAALPGTREEVAAIRGSSAGSFGTSAVTELTGQQATESAVRKEAEKHQYLHFSTHGFFAPPEVASALAPASQAARSGTATAAARQDVSGYHPGLLSGLVLAGANRPIDEANEDGILTALEVAEMDLGNVELATLSACETGLGATGGGEGLLGLQRAFQAAGARTVIAGLWKVPDKATQVLMSRFYDNLWQKRMTKIDALREAQLWMLHQGAQAAGQSTRGLDIDEAQPVVDGKELPPYYWAAFILSGDWR